MQYIQDALYTGVGYIPGPIQQQQQSPHTSFSSFFTVSFSLSLFFEGSFNVESFRLLNVFFLLTYMKYGN